MRHPMVTGIRREAVRLCGIRQEPLESWIKDAEGRNVPELGLNSLLMREAFLQLLATGLGALILVSAATVVAWTSIKKKDFWFITAIGIIQIAKVVGFISGPTVRFLVQFPPASVHRILISRRTRRGHDVGDVTEFVGLASLVPILFAAAPMAIAVACYELSLVGLSALQYGGSDTDTRRGKIKPALIVFYSLVLAQGTVFVLWCSASANRAIATQGVSHKYFGIGNTFGIELMDRYTTQTQDKCIEKGVFSTTNRTLVSFAAELLQSEHPSDHVSAVSVLRVLTTRKERTAGAVKQISSSEQIVGNLFKLLRPKSPLVLEIKAETAEILTKLACNLRLTDIPGAAHSILSLLGPHPRMMRITELRTCMGLGANEAGEEPSPPGDTQTLTNDTNQGGAEAQSTRETHISIANAGGAEPTSPQEIQIETSNTNDDEGGERDKPLTFIVHGLMILDKLASDPGNCTEICKTTDLVPKILAPLTYGLLNTLGNDPKTIQIVKASLRVVAKLTSRTCESSSKLRRELISENRRAAENIMWIMRNSSEQEMRILAVEILTRLTLGVKRMRRFIAYLKGLLIDPQHRPSPLRVSAGKALSALAVSRRNREVIWDQVGDDFSSLVTAMNNADGNSTEHRAVIAEFLAQICAKSKTNQARTRDRLISVSNTLSTVLEAIVTGTEIAEMTERRKFLVSFLGLAVQIREKLVTAEAFANAVRGLPMGNNIFSENVFYFMQDGQASFRFIKFAKKLNEIIVEMKKEYGSEDEKKNESQDETKNKSEDEMKNESEDETCLLITKAATKLVAWTMSIDPVYGHYFQQENIVGKLQDIEKAMGDFERCVALRGDADEMGPYETLVENVRTLIPLAPQLH